MFSPKPGSFFLTLCPHDQSAIPLKANQDVVVQLGTRAFVCRVRKTAAQRFSTVGTAVECQEFDA